MNIALLMHELLVEGGGERQCVSLARALARRGHQVVVYTSAHDPVNCFPEICRDIKVIEVGRGLWPGLRNPAFLRGWLDMRHLARTVRAKHEIWNPHHWPAQWGALWLKSRRGGAVLWMCNDVPNLYEKSLQRKSIGLISAAVHRIYYLFDRAQNRKIDLTMFLSRWAESEFKKIYSGATCVVRSGADPVRFSPGGDREKIRNRFGCKPDEFVLLWLGIFMPHRRLQDAIEAASLLVARGAKVRDFYCACDAFLFPNENQTWGLAVLEAMACGVPVLVSRGAAVHEVLTDNENAVLFPARDPETLAQKVDYLIKQPQERSRIAQAGLVLIRTQYNWEEFARQVSALCARLSATQF